MQYIKKLIMENKGNETAPSKLTCRGELILRRLFKKRLIYLLEGRVTQRGKEKKV